MRLARLRHAAAVTIAALAVGFIAPAALAVGMDFWRGIPNTLNFDTWIGRTAANTVTMGASGAETGLNKAGTGDMGIGPNSANSVFWLYAGSAGGARTRYASIDLNGIHLQTGASRFDGVGGVLMPATKSGTLSGQTSTQTIITFTSPGSITYYEISGYLNLTAWTTPNITGFQISYTDCSGVARTADNVPVHVVGAGATLNSGLNAAGAAGEMSGVGICVNTSTTVTLQVNVAGGTATYSAYAWMRQEN